MNTHSQRSTSLLLSKSLPWFWFLIAFLIVLFDQWTKVLATQNISFGHQEVITSFFNLTLRHNYGIAFSIFDDIHGGQRWPLSILAFLVSLVLVVWITKIGRKASFEVCGLALILGGAIGNLYDRVLLGYVVDFIELHYKGYYWPAFNIADSAICVGAALIMLDAFKPGSGKSKN